MRLDGLPDQFEEFVERVRAALDQEIAAAKSAAVAAHAEKSAAQNALTELQSQLKQTQSQLDAVTKDLQRVSTRVGLDREIAAARKTLEGLKVDIEKATAAKAAVEKQCTEADARLVALGNEARRQVGIRTEAEAAIAAVKAKVFSVQLGNRP
jgi:chromosome segregation ATPase